MIPLTGFSVHRLFVNSKLFLSFKINCKSYMYRNIQQWTLENGIQ
jgi:hypothetical protein